MDDEVNEDLIKATIRRVSEARAAQTRAGEAESERSHADAPAPVRDPNEGAIEAAIQRVAEAKAAQDAEAFSRRRRFPSVNRCLRCRCKWLPLQRKPAKYLSRLALHWWSIRPPGSRSWRKKMARR